MNNIDRIKNLYSSYKNREISAMELEEFLSILKNDKDAEDELIKWIENDLLEHHISNDPIIDRIIQKAETNIFAEISKNNTKSKTKPTTYIIAASIIAILAASIIAIKQIYYTERQNTSTELAVLDDVQPGDNRATLKLSDGRLYNLADENAEIRIEGKNLILNDTAKISEITESAIELELATPRKGNYKAILPDGTKAWLNASSKIIYPSKFNQNERKIKVSGEVYLEVAKVNNSKFIVELDNNREIEVLGTKFNINAYEEQDYVKTSLIEGKVKLTNQFNKTALLVPGQKGVLDNDANNIMVTSTNLENDLAWLNKKFNFEDLTFEESMLQIARWYDVEIIYKSEVPTIEFYGELSKQNTLKDLISIFIQSGVNMNIKNQQLIIE